MLIGYFFEAASHARSAQMRPIATDVARCVVCLSVCVLGTRLSYAKTAEPIEMPFGADSRRSEEPCRPTRRVRREGWQLYILCYIAFVCKLMVWFAFANP